MNSKNKVSVIVPTMGFPDSVNEILHKLKLQTHQPDEVILVDSSIDDSVKEIAKKYKSFLNIELIEVNKAFPGEARNLGVKKSSYSVLAFLDSKTIPNEDWLKNGLDKLEIYEDSIIFGSTLYKAKTKKQKIIQACIFGSRPITTTPGSILNKKTFLDIGYFVEGVRTSDDLEWRNRILRNNLITIIPSTYTLTYSHISKEFGQEIKRQFIYQIHSAFTDVQLKTKTVIFGLSLILLTLIIPQWNALVGWEESFLYIPNITKSYFYLISAFSFVILAFSSFYKEMNVLIKFIVGIFFIISCYVVFQWNFVMADWIEESVFYIPHITKIYLSTLILMALLFRGIYKPLTMGISKNYLFLVRWLWIGIIGIILDLAKIPGYLLGALIALKRRLIG